jgi:hypothetical protein
VTRVVRTADELGFDAIAFTEHPAPSLRWVEAGGHETLDLTSALACCAAATDGITLMTHLLVRPYHNPFAAVKALMTVDLLSDGRLVVVAGTGYLEAEFKALGVDFRGTQRTLRRGPRGHEGRLVRGALRVHREALRRTRHRPPASSADSRWPTDPHPRQLCVVAAPRCRNHGWSPLLVSHTVARTSRMPSVTLAELACQISEVRAAATLPGFMVQVQRPETDVLRTVYSVEAHRDHLGQLSQAGVDQCVIQLPGSSLAAALGGLERYAAEFL